MEIVGSKKEVHIMVELSYSLHLACGITFSNSNLNKL